MWENAEDELERLAISKKSSYNARDGVVINTYKVPVIGHNVVDNNTDNAIIRDKNDPPQKRDKRCNWLKWNNVYYDPSFIYKYDGNEGQTCGILTKISKINLDDVNIQDTSVLCSGEYNERFKNPYIELDLGHARNISHIVMKGPFVPTTHFPKHLKKIKRRRAINYRSNVWDKPRNGYVRIISNNDNISWVSSYSVKYRDTLTGRWKPYEGVFSGNCNAFDSAITEVDIYSRHIRITPIDYTGKKVMQVKIYGPSNGNNEDKEIIQTVTYNVTPQNCASTRCDGFNSGRHGSFYDRYRSKNAKKTYLKRFLKDELDFYDSTM